MASLPFSPATLRESRASSTSQQARCRHAGRLTTLPCPPSVVLEVAKDARRRDNYEPCVDLPHSGR